MRQLTRELEAEDSLGGNWTVSQITLNEKPDVCARFFRPPVWQLQPHHMRNLCRNEVEGAVGLDTFERVIVVLTFLRAVDGCDAPDVSCRIRFGCDEVTGSSILGVVRVQIGTERDRGLRVFLH